MTALDWTEAEGSGSYAAQHGPFTYVITAPGKGRRRPFIVYFPDAPSATTDTLREAKELAQQHADSIHVDAAPVLEEECASDDVPAMIGAMIGSTVLQIVRQTERQAYAVQLAREHGLSWAWIGDHLGVTKQSAQAKFGSKTPLTPPQTEGFPF